MQCTIVLQTRILANESKRGRHSVQNIRLSTFDRVTQTFGKILFGLGQASVITVIVPNRWSHL